MFAALLVGLLAGACELSQPLPTYNQIPGASPAGVILEGTLMTAPDSPCLLVKPVGRPAFGLLWPSGYTSRGRPVRIYSPAGVEVAAEGDLVTVAGDASSKPSPYCRTESTLLVSQITRGPAELAP